MSKKAIRIVAIVLAALIFLGVFAGAIINTFAIGCDTASTAPTMGEQSKIVPIIIVAVAALVGGACFAFPKLRNKPIKENAAGDTDEEKED